MHRIPDLLLDREKLLMKMRRWKWLFFVSLAISTFLITKKDFAKHAKEFIARIEINGVIDHSPELLEELQAIKENKNIKALIIYVDSPGGTTYAGEELYEAIKSIKKDKPVASVMGTVAASGGYMVALATDYIVARNMTITGSIGVLSQNYELVDLANKLGIKFENFKSSPLKASPNPFEKTSEQVKIAEQQVIKDSYDLFLKMLMESRKMTQAQALQVADGRIFIGKRAKTLNLIDQIGGEQEALLWLQKEKKLDDKLKVYNVSWEKPKNFLEGLSKYFDSAKIYNFLLNKPSIQAIAK